MNHQTVSREFIFVQRISGRDPSVEFSFYKYCHEYYTKSFFRVLGTSSGLKDDLFHDAFIQIWTEIQNGRIYLNDGAIWRTPMKGESAPMSCSLRTFIMRIVRNLYLKEKRHPEACLEDDTTAWSKELAEDLLVFDSEPVIDKMKIVECCVAQMPKHCREILTLFYLEKKSLDEILALRPGNTSKNGLKTGKKKCMDQLKVAAVSSYKKQLMYGQAGLY